MFVGSRLDAYKKELEDYKSDLLDYKNLAITGIYKVGSRSMVSALFENISNLFDLAIIDDNFLTIDSILKSINNTSGKILLAIPNYSQRDLQFQGDFQRLLQGSKLQIHTIINVSLKDYINLDTVFSISVKPIRKVKILLPRDFSQTKILIKEYLPDLSDDMLLAEIFKLSGGIPGLVKSACNVYKMYGTLTIQNMLDDESTKIILDKLLAEYRQLNEFTKISSGYVDSKQNIQSVLLKDYSESFLNHKNSMVEKLINLFIKEKSMIVSLDRVDAFISENGEFSLWNRYKLIERVRDSLPKSYKLKTIRNKGYKLIDA